MRELAVDPKVVPDLMGHDVNVNLNIYTQTALESRLQAVIGRKGGLKGGKARAESF
jgi:hypothetical protein